MRKIVTKQQQQQQPSIQIPDSFFGLISRYTVCPGSSDPPEKIFQYICIRKLGLQRFF